jgi:hypothetical protein
MAAYKRDRRRSLNSAQFPLQMTEYINAVGVREQAHRLRARRAKVEKA